MFSLNNYDYYYILCKCSQLKEIRIGKNRYCQVTLAKNWKLESSSQVVLSMI